ncbi:SxtJ family membrane protein [Bacteroidota bacterium]
MKPASRTKSLETCLVLAGALILFYFVKSKEVLLYISFGFIFIGVFIKPLAAWIASLWLKFGDLLGYLVSKVVLGALFFLILFPISMFYRLSKKDPLRIKNHGKSTWISISHTYQGKDMENIW